MENTEKQEDLLRKDKIFRIVNYCLMVLLFLTCVGIGIYYYVIGDPNNRLLACVGVSLLFIAPILIELIFRIKISNFIVVCLIVYSFLAGFLGSLLNFYNLSTLELNEWYDVFIHTLAGYVFSFIGLIFISRLQNYKKLNPWTVLLFCVFFTLATELVWELIEWFADSCLGQTSQGHPPVGQPAPLVTDTNLDMLCNFSGSIIFAAHFIVAKFSKVNLGMSYIEKELCENKLFSRKAKKKKVEETKHEDYNESNNSINVETENLFQNEDVSNSENQIEIQDITKQKENNDKEKS